MNVAGDVLDGGQADDPACLLQHLDEGILVLLFELLLHLRLDPGAFQGQGHFGGTGPALGRVGVQGPG